MGAPSSPPKPYTVAEAAADLGKDVATVRRWLEDGVLEGWRPYPGRGPWEVSRKDVRRLLALRA